jgi:hypothetical protein
VNFLSSVLDAIGAVLEFLGKVLIALIFGVGVLFLLSAASTVLLVAMQYSQSYRTGESEVEMYIRGTYSGIVAIAMFMVVFLATRTASTPPRRDDAALREISHNTARTNEMLGKLGRVLARQDADSGSRNPSNR